MGFFVLVEFYVGYVSFVIEDVIDRFCVNFVDVGFGYL